MTDVPRPVPQITEQLIAALVPATVIPQPAAVSLPALPASVVPDRPNQGPVLIATCVMDHSGRVNAAPLLKALAWAPGDLIDVDLLHGVVVVEAIRTGRHVIGVRGDIGIPAAVRAMCGIHPDHQVLLAALVDQRVLVIHSVGAVARLLARRHHRILGDLHDR
ncbi:MAG TPA: hypothetical protein VFC19_43065 [Candidatus Limnocylindrales bacterium]|nr:hypothetical protein [Candidatus Limnocylindrales bacterium]